MLKDGGWAAIQFDLLFLFVFGIGTLLIATPLFKRSLLGHHAANCIYAKKLTVESESLECSASGSVCVLLCCAVILATGHLPAVIARMCPVADRMRFQYRRPRKAEARSLGAFTAGTARIPGIGLISIWLPFSSLTHRSANLWQTLMFNFEQFPERLLRVFQVRPCTSNLNVME